MSLRAKHAPARMGSRVAGPKRRSSAKPNKVQGEKESRKMRPNPESDAGDQPKIVITVVQGGNAGARGNVRVEGRGLYIVKTKLYVDKIRYIVASEERRFFREIDVKMSEDQGPVKTTVVRLQGTNELVEEYLGDKLLRVARNGQPQSVDSVKVTAVS